MSLEKVPRTGSAIPLKRYGFTLTKPKFRDVLSFIYNIGAKECPLIREFFAKIMEDFGCDVEIEPDLQLLQGESYIHKILALMKRR